MDCSVHKTQAPKPNPSKKLEQSQDGREQVGKTGSDDLTSLLGDSEFGVSGEFRVQGLRFWIDQVETIGAIAFAGGIEGTHVGPEDSNFQDCSNVMFPDVYEVEIWKMRGLVLFSQSSQAHVQRGDGRELLYLLAASCCAGHGILLNLQPFKTISVRSLSADNGQNNMTF